LLPNETVQVVKYDTANAGILVRVTRCFCKNVAQNVAQTIFCPIYYDKISIDENGSSSLAIFCNFRKMLQRKTSSTGGNSPNLVTLILVRF
jgi:hypothetical protein